MITKPIHHNSLIDKIFGTYYECPECSSKLLVTDTFEHIKGTKGRWIYKLYKCNKCNYTFSNLPIRIKIGDIVKYSNDVGIIIGKHESKYSNKIFKMMEVRFKDIDRSIAEGLLTKVNL